MVYSILTGFRVVLSQQSTPTPVEGAILYPTTRKRSTDSGPIPFGLRIRPNSPSAAPHSYRMDYTTGQRLTRLKIFRSSSQLVVNRRLAFEKTRRIFRSRTGLGITGYGILQFILLGNRSESIYLAPNPSKFINEYKLVGMTTLWNHALFHDEHAVLENRLMPEERPIYCGISTEMTPDLQG